MKVMIKTTGIPHIENPSPSVDPYLEKAGENIRAAVADLIARGIIDAQGIRIRQDLPPDMRGEADRDFGG